MSGKSLLNVSRPAARTRSTPDQDRFRYLIEQIEKIRRARANWEGMILEFRRSDSDRVQPLRATLRQVSRDTVFVIDRLLEQKGWSRADQTALRQIACDTAEMLLQADPNDAELKAAFDRHSGISFDAAKQEELDELKEQARQYMGVDLDEDEIQSEEDLVERVYEHMKREEEGKEGRRKSAAQQRVEASAQAAKKFLREIYRKLASAVHPDREADAVRRAEKNELMQKINRAYATNDLLTLLEAQLRLEQIDPDHISKLSGDRVKQFNRLLSEQLAAAKTELRKLEEDFRVEHGVDYGRKVTPQSLHLVTQQRAREIRMHITRQKHFLEILATKTATKRWLKEQRRFQEAFFDEDED